MKDKLKQRLKSIETKKDPEPINIYLQTIDEHGEILGKRELFILNAAERTARENAKSLGFSSLIE